MKVLPLPEGNYTVDKSKKAIPYQPGIDSMKDRPGSVYVSVQPFLVIKENYKILLDTGFGKSTDNELAIVSNLKKNGIKREEITHVFLSHLHKDHCGGIFMEIEKSYKLSFPNAIHVVNRNEFELALSDRKNYPEPEIFEELQRSGMLEFTEGNGTILPGVDFEMSGGHTPYHQVFYLRDSANTFFFGGDVVPVVNQLLHLFTANYDSDGVTSRELRKKYAQK